MLNSPCNLASVKLFKAGYLHCLTHEKMFVGKVLLNRWLLFVNVYAFGCRLQGQTFNPLNYFFLVELLFNKVIYKVALPDFSTVSICP